MHEIELKGYNGNIRILITETDRNVSDQFDLVQTEVHLQVDGFSGMQTVDFFFGDLLGFLKKLRVCYDEVRGVANLQSEDGKLGLNVALETGGQLTASGILKASPGSQSELAFELKADQSYLLSFFQDVGSVKIFVP